MYLHHGIHGTKLSSHSKNKPLNAAQHPLYHFYICPQRIDAWLHGIRHWKMDSGEIVKPKGLSHCFQIDVHAIRLLEHSYSLLSATPLSGFLSAYPLPNFQYPRHFGKLERSWQQHVEMPRSTWNHQWCHSQSCHFIQSLLSKSHTFFGRLFLFQ